MNMCTFLTGILSVWNLLNVVEMGSYMNIDKITLPNVECVLSGQHVNISRALYDRAAVCFPVKVILSPEHVSSTSFSVSHEFLDAKDNKFLFASRRQFAFQHKTTGQSVPVPDDFVRYHENVANNTQRWPGTTGNRQPPRDAIRVQRQVCHSDADHLYVTSPPSYIKFCMDAAAYASNNNKLQRFIGDFFQYKVSSVSTQHQGKSYPEDELQVTLWEDPEELEAMHFHISKDNSCIFTATFRFRTQLQDYIK